MYLSGEVEVAPLRGLVPSGIMNTFKCLEPFLLTFLKWRKDFPYFCLLSSCEKCPKHLTVV